MADRKAPGKVEKALDSALGLWIAGAAGVGVCIYIVMNFFH
jgi:hypothetical protein